MQIDGYKELYEARGVKRRREKEKTTRNNRIKIIPEWDGLPIELKDMIFSYLKVQEIAIFLLLSKEDGPLAYSHLDKHFKEVEFSEVLVKKSSLDFIKWVFSYPGKGLTQLCFKNELSLNFVDQFEKWHNLENLEHLDLSLCTIPDVAFTKRLVEDVLLKTPKLRILNLNYNNLVFEADQVEQLVKACPNLEEIHFKNASKLTHVTVLTILKECKNLRILDLQNCITIRHHSIHTYLNTERPKELNYIFIFFVIRHVIMTEKWANSKQYFKRFYANPK